MHFVPLAKITFFSVLPDSLILILLSLPATKGLFKKNPKSSYNLLLLLDSSGLLPFPPTSVFQKQPVTI